MFFSGYSELHNIMVYLFLFELIINYGGTYTARQSFIV